MSVQYKLNNGVATFTLDNGRLNLCTMDMHKELHHRYLEFLNDETAKVAVITGSGDNFCAGDDLKESDTPLRSRDKPRWDEVTMGHRRSKPMIAAVNGWCLGAGMMYMMLLTDIRVAGTSARFGLPEIAYGMGGASGALRLGMHIPPVAAAYLGLTGEKIDVAEAHRLFMVNEVVDSDMVLKRALEIAETIASHSLLSIQTEVDCLHRGMELSRADALQYATGQYITQRRLHRAEAGEAIDLFKSTNRGDDA